MPKLPRIAVFGLIALLALAVFGGFALRGLAQGSPPPLKSDQYLKDTSFLSGDPCGPPCFAGITPGKTSYADALKTLQSQKRFGTITTPSANEAAWSSEAGQVCCQLIGDQQSGLVSEILIKVAPSVTAKQMLDKFGNPTYTQTVDYSPTEVAVALIYPKNGLMAWVSPGGPATSVLADSPVVVVLYFAPEQFETLFASVPLQGWDGFKSYTAFKATTPVVTPRPPPTLPAQPSPVPSADDLKSPCYAAIAPDPNTTKPPANAPKQFAKPDQVIDPTHTYCAFFTTEHGVVVVELFAKYAPQHVNSFVFLAQQGFFDGITWHRVITGFVAQTGDPTGSGTGGPGYTIPLETNPAVKYDRAGMLGMARTNDPNSAGSQFFITYAPLPNLDAAGGSPGYTIFGRVVRGLEFALQIRARDQGDPPGEKLIAVRIVDAK